MEKNFLQDVVPPSNNRSIRNIPINSNRRRSITSSQIQDREPQKTNQDIKEKSPKRRMDNISTASSKRQVENNSFDLESYKEPRSIRKYFIILGGIIGIILLIFILTNFSGAEVTIYPKQAEANVNTVIEAQDKDTVSQSDILSYQKVSISEESSRKVEASGEEEVEQKAFGKITIYNNYSDKGQPLVKNTRFETTSGLIFRIDSSVTVPGKTDSGPGQIEVQVFADGVGEDYNIPPSSFTIPGFKGLPQYDSFNAKSTENMSGGFVGTKKIVKDEDIEATLNDLQGELKTKLEAKLNEQIDKEHVLVYDPSSFIFEILPQKDSGKEVEIIVKGTLNASVFNIIDLSKEIAKNSLKNYSNNDPIKIKDIKSLTIETRAGEADQISLSIDGGAEFIWQTDNELLKNDLKGKTRKDLKDVLQNYQSITRAEAVIKPFWKKTFPKSIEKITVVIGEDK